MAKGIIVLLLAAAIPFSGCSRKEANEARRTLVRWVRKGNSSLDRLAERLLRKDSLSARLMVEGYWKAVFRGRTGEAYRMLTMKSRRRTSFDDYSRKVAFGPRRTPEEASFWEAYSRLASVSVGQVKIKGDSAEVKAIITFPYMAEIIDELEPAADSLFLTQDSLSKKEWLLGELAARIGKKEYRPFVMVVDLRLRWEPYDWHLVYE